MRAKLLNTLSRLVSMYQSIQKEAMQDQDHLAVHLDSHFQLGFLIDYWNYIAS